jgi:hypothetical protein
MTRGHRAWHRLLWLTLGPLILIALVAGLYLRMSALSALPTTGNAAVTIAPGEGSP